MPRWHQIVAAVGWFVRPGNERLVDLQRVNLQVLKARKRGTTGAEIVY
jgi:hypothetical protein